MFAGKIAATWPEYFQQQQETFRLPPTSRALSGTWLNSLKALILVREQCNGIKRAGAKPRKIQYTDEEIMAAIGKIIPELFAEYWEAINTKEFSNV